MKRTVLLSILLVTAVALSLALLLPKPLHAILCCDNAGYQTAWQWEMAATCADAQAAHRAKSYPDAQATCYPDGVCAFSVPACYPSGSMFVSDGPATFGCRYACTIYQDPYQQ